MSKIYNANGCRIEITSKKGNSLALLLHFQYNHLISPTESPKYTINGVIIFQLKVERTSNSEYSAFVWFSKKRVHDKLYYTISYTNWTGDEMKFETKDRWQYVGRYSINVLPAKGSILVEVNLTNLPSPCASLYEDIALTDFELHGVDGFVPAHKAIAAAYSPFFKKMFEGQWKETAEGVVKVPNVSQATLQHFKEYMYLGTLPKTCLDQLLLLSKLYMMEDLENRCLFMLRTELTKDNVYDLMEFAGSHKLTGLLYEILDSVQEGDFEVKEIEKFKEHVML